MLRLAVFAAALALAAVAAAKRADNPYCNMDPFINPAKDLCNPLRYIPNLPLNATAVALYGACASVFTFHEFRHRGKYFLCLTIGTWCEAIGLALRIALRKDPHSLGLYISMYMFVVLSPCAFLAADYILLGRMVKHLKASRYLFLNPDKVSWTFVLSDIITFCIQAAGGSMSTSDGLHKVGSNIFLAGLILQLMSFALFSMLYVIFLFRVRKDSMLWSHPGWKPLYFALGFTCIMFLTRSVFRTIELSQGYAGHLTIHEVYWASLDALPLLLGIAVYCYFWPPAILTPESAVTLEPESSADMTETSSGTPSHATEDKA
ncbi:hypothetical protein CspeluHIS016_0603700 [Cutaneotrichosporon spelunceum]|uniref:RTA1-domain-containing protein n=1 Tax=Cutaneotrichosporon spelunceum TaxID=1672016 RepID=A0AAD3YE96_9TREE|nr:hypothetical protein CspeluHIS016_0603700 [Cutaneotrichosporon spelunceum]